MRAKSNIKHTGVIYMKDHAEVSHQDIVPQSHEEGDLTKILYTFLCYVNTNSDTSTGRSDLSLTSNSKQDKRLHRSSLSIPGMAVCVQGPAG